MAATKVDLGEQVQGSLAVANGGTGGTDQSSAQSGLGLVPGTNVQAYSSTLATWATKTPPSGTAVGTSDTQTLTGKTINGSNNTLTNIALASLASAAYATAPTASTLAEWDANANLSAANLIEGFTSTATAGGTTTLTIASNETQVFTGSSNQTCQLPTTSVPAGLDYTIINASTGTVTVTSSNGSTLVVLGPSTSVMVTSLQATPTAPTHWNSQYIGILITSGKVLKVSNSLTLAGTDGTTMTFPGASDTVVTLTATQTLSNKTQTNPIINGYTEGTQALGTVGSTATIGALTNGTEVTATLTSATPCTFTMPTAVQGMSFTLVLRQPSSGTPTTATFTGVKWPASGAPVITATVGKADAITFFCPDGSNWYGTFVQGYTY